MFRSGIASNTEARRLPGRFQVPWTWIVLAVLALAIAVGLGFGVKSLFSSRTNTVPVVIPAIQQPVAQPVQQVPAPVIKEWPKVEVAWKSNPNPTLVPPVDDPIYSGVASDGVWWGPGSTPADHNEVVRRQIAMRLVPSITDKDGTSLSIRRNPDNPAVVIASVGISRDMASEVAAAQSGVKFPPIPQEETHLFLSVDNEKTWKEIGLSFVRSYPDTINKVAIDDVIVTGTSKLLLSVSFYSSHGYQQAEYTP